MSNTPVLILGGYGSVGSKIAQTLRRFHPALPIAIAGRNAYKAKSLAGELGNATVVSVDLERADLGLPDHDGFSVVVAALRDLSLNSMRYAQTHKTPYIALSDGIFEIGPTVARAIHRPTASPVVLLGHAMGAVPMLATVHYARRFRSIDSIELGLVFDPKDPLGAASAIDMDRIYKIGPSPLILKDGRWCWISGDEATRVFTGVDGREHEGTAVGLLDVLSLSVTPTKSIRVDFAEGETASSRRGENPSHEVIIEISGQHEDGTIGKRRYELVDPQGYSALSARGIAATIESLLGLSGQAVPEPGIYMPEMLVDTDRLMVRLAEQGVLINEPS